MAREQSPWFQFYPLDWLGDSKVLAMTLEARGAYITLLCLCWRDGHLCSDPTAIGRLVGMPKAIFLKRIWPQLRPCFTLVEEGWIQKRIEVERQKKEAFRQSASRAGKMSAAARAASTTVERPLNDRATEEAREVNSSSSLSLSLKKEDLPPSPLRGSADDPFMAFWTVYPRKIGKGAAERAFRKCGVPLEVLVAAVTAQAQSKQWQRDGGQFIPHPSTWLNQGRWQDEAEPMSADMPVTEEEFAIAAEVRRKAWGRCPHDPACEDSRACVLLIALERRTA